MDNNGLIVFVKNLVCGKVKTRLAKEIGDHKALEIYKSLLLYTKSEVDETLCSKYLFYSDYLEKNDIWPDNNYSKHIQSGTDLGNKMSNAMDFVLKTHEKVVIIGSDCPLISTDIINTAFARLHTYDVVIGPAEDGGYYLIGLSKHCNPLFVDINWSTDQVLSQTLVKLKALQLSFHLLETLPDIDLKEDLELYGKNL